MQGFNMGRYVPPDLEGTVSGNALHAKPPPGRSASKPGVQTVRFEMPFPIWCASCPKPTVIAQGVRFNAEKRRTGAYHSTPVWSFRMRHPACGGTLEIATDPRNTAYVVVAGATKRDHGADARDGDLVVMTDDERAALRASAFAGLEKTIEDREAAAAAVHRIDDLEHLAARRWDDPYARNRALRRTFRAGRHEREARAAADDAVRDRAGLALELLPEVEADARRAALVDFGPPGDGDGPSGSRALAEPLFGKPPAKPPGTSRRGAKPAATPKGRLLASRRRDGFVSEVVGNTRLATDPFLVDGKAAKPRGLIPGIKRKRDAAAGDEERPSSREPPRQDAAPSTGLVAYDSDSE